LALSCPVLTQLADDDVHARYCTSYGFGVSCPQD